jgi:hypothetical protein
MLKTACPEDIPMPPIALVFAIVVASCLAGGILVLFTSEIAFAVLMQLLNPGSNTFYAISESPFTAFYFPIKLFFAGSLFIAVPLVTAWLVSTDWRQYTRMAVLLFASSVLVSSAAFCLYRQYMQVQLTDLRMYGQLQPPRSKGSITRLGDVPIAMLTLSGPLLASAFVLMRRRRIGQIRS